MPVTPDDPVSFISGNPKVASVNPVTGEIKALKAGSATITAPDRFRSHRSVPVDCPERALEGRHFRTQNRYRRSGSRCSFRRRSPPAPAARVTWSLPAEQANLATIDAATGLVSAKSGTGTITPNVRTYDGNSKTASIQISIVPAPSYLMLNRPTLTLCAGDQSGAHSGAASGQRGAR